MHKKFLIGIKAFNSLFLLMEYNCKGERLSEQKKREIKYLLVVFTDDSEMKIDPNTLQAIWTSREVIESLNNRLKQAKEMVPST